MKKTVFILMLALGLGVSFTVYAQPMNQAMPMASSLRGNAGESSAFLKAMNLKENDAYANTAVSKAGDGMINAVTCWTDIPKEVVRVNQEENVLMAATVGLGGGIFYGVTRGVSGVYDMATFGIPPYNDPVMQPEYKVNRPQQEGLKIDILKW